jgi:transcriptional regulator with XRE-family HTH domain
VKRPRLQHNRDFYGAVGNQIAILRKSRGITQEQLAAKILMTRTSVINIEKGRQQVLVHTLFDISRALQVPVSKFLPGEESLESLLRNQPKKGREWIESALSAKRSK